MNQDEKYETGYVDKMESKPANKETQEQSYESGSLEDPVQR
jgi:hypothetical protein